MLLAAIIGCLLLQSLPLPAGDKDAEPGESGRLWALEQLVVSKNPDVRKKFPT